MPLCFSVDLEPEVTSRRSSQIIVERRRTSTPSRKVTVPVVFPPPPIVYPAPQYALQSHCTHTETQVIVAAPQEEKKPEPAQTILNINIEQAASEIAENLAKENMLRNQVAVLESSLDEERRAREREESARRNREIEEIYVARETRRRSRSREERIESRSREVSVGYAAEEAARQRISHEYRHHHHHRSSSSSRHASPRSSGDRLMIMAEHSSPRHSGDRLVVAHERHRSHEAWRHRCSLCNHHGHVSADCSESEPDVIQVPRNRVRYWQV